MHNIFNINRSVAGHHIDFDNHTLDIKKNESNFSINRTSNTFKFNIDTITSEVNQNALKCTVRGWAYSVINTAPAKSIYIAHNGKIIAKAKIMRRIDVRADQELTFDHCGFEASFNLPNTHQHVSIATVILTDGSGAELHHVRIVNDLHANRFKSLASKLDSTVSRTTESSFEYGIENAIIRDNSLIISGWCYLKSNPNSSIYVNFIKSGVFLGEATCQTELRPDIGDKLNYKNGFSFFGFKYESFNLQHLPLSPQDRSIDMLLAAGPDTKEIIRIYSE